VPVCAETLPSVLTANNDGWLTASEHLYSVSAQFRLYRACKTIINNIEVLSFDILSGEIEIISVRAIAEC